MQDYIISFLVTRFFDQDGTLVMYNWLNSENVRITDSNHPIYVFVQTGGNKKIASFEVNGDFGDFEYLVANKFLVISQDESRKDARIIYEESRNLESLNLVLMPADQQCNFSCVYCHEDHNKRSRMGETELGILEKFISKWNPQTFRVDYFGGEPLLNAKFIKKFNSKMIELADSGKFTFLSSSMTTNGFLLDRKLFLELLNLRITTYQITLDGTEEFHNKYRPLVNGKPTFERIYQNLVSISHLPKEEYFFSITIRMNFNRSSASMESRKKFFDQLKSDFGGDDRFIFMVQMISNWKEEAHDGELYCTEDEGTQLQTEMEHELESMELNTVPMVLFSGPGSNHCYSSKPNNIITYPISEALNGGMPIEKCTLAVNGSINKTGYIDTDGIIHRSDKWDFWTEDSLFKHEKCQECFFALNCFSKSCGLNNLKQNDLVCPEHKFHEVDIVQRVLQFIKNG